MNGLRVVFVTRRFWPLFGGAENALAALATEMQVRAARPTILTTQWNPDWSSRVFYAGVPVTRLPKPRGQAWGTFRYLHGLRRWLMQHGDEIDLVCVSTMRLDAYTTLSALRGTSIPVVLRAEQAGVSGDCQWQQRARFGGRVRQKCRTAAAVIATDVGVARELREADFDPRRIHLIHNGTAIQTARSPVARAAARQALADANADLKTGPATKVVVFIGRLKETSGLTSLLRAWPHVLRDRPDAKLWLIGDGPFRDGLGQRLVEMESRSSVVLPGSFDEVDEILTAADAMVCPSCQPGTPQVLLEGASARLPIVAVDTPDIRACRATSGENTVLVPPDDPAAMGRAITRILNCPPPTHALHAACRTVEREFSPQRMCDDHCSLFQRLIRQRNEWRRPFRNG